MKRSEVNRYVTEAMKFFEDNHFYLPEWTRWGMEEWKKAGPECDEIRSNMLGWDITDFRQGRFPQGGAHAGDRAQRQREA
jgi:D-lyxose ketol-isomerase